MYCDCLHWCNASVTYLHSNSFVSVEFKDRFTGYQMLEVSFVVYVIFAPAEEHGKKLT